MRRAAALAALLLTVSLAAVPAGAAAAPRTFANPLALRLPDGSQAVNCAASKTAAGGPTIGVPTAGPRGP